MSTRMTMERVFAHVKDRSPARRHRLLLLLFAALLCFNAGCAQKQAPPLQSGPAKAASQEADVVAAARKNLGIPYRFGGARPETGFDCSGLVCWSYEQVGVKVPRRASEQVAFGTPVKSRAELQPGDIVAFKGTRSRTGWHSGIYTGNGKFIHSPNKGKSVMESSLDEGYFAKRYYGACRIPRDGSADSLYAAYRQKLTAQANAAKASRAANKSGAKSVAVKNRKNAPKAQTTAAKSRPAKNKNSGKKS